MEIDSSSALDHRLPKLSVLDESHAILQRMRELAVQAATDTNTVDDRAEIQKEIDAFVEELDRISTDTEFNTQTLLDGEFESMASICATKNDRISEGNHPALYKIAS